MYKTTGTIDTKLVMASQRYFSPSRKAHMILGMEVLYVIMCIVGLVKRIAILVLFAVALGLILLVAYALFKSKQKKFIEKRQKALGNGQDALVMSVDFNENSFGLINETNGTVTDIKYDNIGKVLDFNDISIFQTKEGQIFYVFKNQLSKEDVDAIFDIVNKYSIFVKTYNRNLV